MRREIVLSIVLLLLICAVFEPIRGAQFVLLDDFDYVAENRMVRSGLSTEGIRWAFTTFTIDNWFPITWLSYMLDVELFGVDPAGHHLVNVGLHSANAVLLFVLLRCTTGFAWRSAFVAALFAVHPLHVESVAWIAERKDVLSTFFWLLGTLVWVPYARRGSRTAYAGTFVLLALGLMTKPMLVTFPFTLLLLDVWPLGRTRFAHAAVGPPRVAVPVSRLFVEKLPLVLLSVVSSAVTVSAQGHGDSIRTLDAYPLAVRLANALVAYVSYAATALWPRGLAVFYPHPMTWPSWIVVGSALVLLSFTALALRWIKRLPWLGVGWLWYLGTLVPVIGIVQVGGQWMADRYTYVPLIGLFVLAVWGTSTLVEGSRKHQTVLAVAGIAGVVCYALAARVQVRYWRDSAALFEHAVSVTEGNYLAYSALGTFRSRAGDVEGGIRLYEEALRLKPDHPMANYNLAKTLIQQGRFQDAVPYLAQLANLFPERPVLRFDLARTLEEAGDLEGAVVAYMEGLAVDPKDVDARTRLGLNLLRLGRSAEAADSFRAALQTGTVAREAKRQLIGLLAVGSEPVVRDPREAVRLAEELLADGEVAEANDFYAAALAYTSADRHAEAVRAAEEAAQRARVSGQLDVAARAEALLRMHR
jgi:tetratricopeptide (TPR) repeat protein